MRPLFTRVLWRVVALALSIVTASRPMFAQDYPTWKKLIKSLYTVSLKENKECQLPFIRDSKLYSHCFREPDNVHRQCCAEPLNFTCASSAYEKCIDYSGILPAFFTVRNYSGASDDSIAGSYFRTNITIKGQPLYQVGEKRQFFVCTDSGWGVYSENADGKFTAAKANMDETKDSCADGIPVYEPILTAATPDDHAAVPATRYQIEPYVALPLPDPFGTFNSANCAILCKDGTADIKLCIESCEEQCNERGFVPASQQYCSKSCTPFSFGGRECQNYCSSTNTCALNGESCKEDGNSCKCAVGWSGTLCAFECVDSDCSGHGRCNPSRGLSSDDSCICDANWVGDKCECNDQKTCTGHGTCSISADRKTVTCKCAPNYFGNDCSFYCDAQYKCNGHGVCNTAANPCKCDKTYDGVSCNYTCSLQCTLNGGECEIRDPSSTAMFCKCPCNRYGELCQEQNKTCEAEGYCKNGGCCTATDQCNCGKGKGLFGKQCEIFQKNCSETFCFDSRGTCHTGYNNNNKFAVKCDCQEGFDGPRCRRCKNYGGKICPCNRGNKQCSGHGRCKKDGNCMCDCNYGGETCDTFLQECYDKKLCKNGGCCQGEGKPGLFGQCLCQKSFYGPRCDITAENCERDYCNGKGECTLVGDRGPNIACSCNRGYTGAFCDQCGAHGILEVIKSGEKKCKCNKGWTGAECQSSVIVLSFVIFIGVGLAVSIAMTLHFYFFVSGKDESGPSGYDDFSVLTVKHRTCCEKLQDFFASCFSHYCHDVMRLLLCSSCREDEKNSFRSRAYKARQKDLGANLFDPLVEVTERESHDFDAKEHGAFNFGEPVKMSYQH